MWLIDGLELQSELIVLIYLKVSFFPKRQKRLRTCKINKQRFPKFRTLEKNSKLFDILFFFFFSFINIY